MSDIPFARSAGRLIARVLLFAAVACQSSPSKSDDSAPPSDATAGGGGAESSGVAAAGTASDVETGGQPDDAANRDLSLPTDASFAEGEELEVEPSTRTTLNLRVAPAGSHAVTVVLMGESVDASLNRTALWTDKDGKATIDVTAPTKATTFSVRATVDQVLDAQIEITVVEVGHASLSVDASYAGIREVETWDVTLYPNTTCTQLMASGEPGAATATSFKEPLPVLVEALPIAEPAAVLLKGDSLVSGCAEVPALAADEVGRVTVTLTDLPLSLRDVELPITLGGDGSMGLRDGVGDSLPNLLEAFADSKDWDVTALLDAMVGAATTDEIKLELNRARAAQTWDTVLWQDLSPQNQHPLRDPLRTWVETAITEFGGDAAFTLALKLSPSKGSPVVEVLEVLSLDAASCGVAPEAPLSLATEAQDRLVWSSTLTWNEGALLGCLAEKAAGVTVPAATTVPRALDLSIDCAGIGTTLASTEDLSGNSAALCGAACLASLCQQGLQNMWDRALLSAGGNALATMTISAAGTMGLSAKAEPSSAEGTWVGILTTPVTSVSVSGLLLTP